MNEDFVKDKQKVIEKACNTIAKHSSISKDLAQEVSIYFLTNPLPERLDKIDGFIFVIAYKMYHLTGSEFKRLHIDNVLLDSEDIDFISDKALPFYDDNVDKEYNKTIKELNEMDVIWTQEIVKRNMSINLFSEQTGISRIKATERMNSIYNKLRNKNK